MHNPPGRSRISRRVVTQATAKATMLRALADPDRPATSRFTARSDDDFGVAIIDAAAVVADIVSRYTERFANEHYLRTAQERRSLVELARLIGYQVRPGLAPTADLAFTLDTTPGAPDATVIPAGTAVQSSPDPGGSPVVFETLADIAAGPRWNAIRPRRTLPHPSMPGTALAFAGVVPIAVGDGVLYRTGTTPALAFGLVGSVTAVDAVPELPGRPGLPARTQVVVSPIAGTVGTPPAELAPQPAQPAPVPASVAWLDGTRLSAADLDAALLGRSMGLADVAGPFAASPPTPATAVVFGQQRPLFGSQSPRASVLAASVFDEIKTTPGFPPAALAWAGKLTLPWEAATVATFPGGAAGDVYLDGASPPVAVGGLLVLRDGATWGAYRVTAADVVGVAGTGISARAVRVHVADTAGLTSFSVRRTTAFTGARTLALADVPAAAGHPGGASELDGLLRGLREGRAVVVTGEPADDRGRPVTAATTLATVVHDFGPARSTTITLADALATTMTRSTMTIAANVAAASQGETRIEVLGSGDARQVFQTFTLRQPPLTYLSSDGIAGMASTLTIWVDGVRWAQVDALVRCGPDDRVFLVTNGDGRSVVQFGDGVTGARLPTGTANIRAVYRSGGDLSGRVGADRLTLPVSRTGGVVAVTNPAPAQGGDDPESVDAARVGAPLRVTTLDRVVSMADYAGYARAFPGVAKAQAVWARAGTHRGVLLTVAGNGGAILLPDRGIGQHLLTAFGSAGDPLVPVALAPYRPRSFRFSAAVRTDPARVRSEVLVQAGNRLSTAFSFGARDLGQPVAASEVLAQIQSVPGVVAVTVTALWMVDPSAPSFVGTSAPALLNAASPLPGIDIGTGTDRLGLAGAELIVLDPAPIDWRVLP
ncbi:hypothetical protein [Nakamurella sp.]|uniref:hypothetical protein n=1 Tax=Nakamurella sp. TaxID=1869182 RepID=UPI003B3BDB5C